MGEIGELAPVPPPPPRQSAWLIPGWIISLAIAAVAATVGYTLGIRQTGGTTSRLPKMAAAAELEPPGLHVESAHLNLGDVWETTEHVCRLPIENKTSAPIDIADVTASCACSSVSPRQLMVPAGGLAEVQLRIDLSHRTPADLDKSERPFVVQVVPIIRGLHPLNSQTPGWTLFGIVKRRVIASVLKIDFGDEPVCNGKPVSRRIEAHVLSDGHHLDAEYDAERFSLEITPPDRANGTASVRLEPKITSEGPFTSTLRLVSVDSQGNRYFGTTIPVEGRMRPEVRLVPARVYLAPCPIGRSVEGRISLEAPANAELFVAQIETTSRFVSVTPIEGDLRSARHFLIRQEIKSVGDITSTIRFRIHRGKGDDQVLESEILAHGIQ